MKLGLILVLVALLVPSVAWLVRGEGWYIVVREGYVTGKYLQAIALAEGRDPNHYDRPPTLLPLRYVLAASAMCLGAGVYILFTARSRFVSSQDTTA